MYHFCFGRAPVDLGYDPGQYVLIERKSAERAAQAFECETWGEMAAVVGLTWEEARAEWDLDDEVEDPEEQTGPEDPFSYAEIVSGWSGGPEVPDPRRVAYRLVGTNSSAWDEVRSASGLLLSHGSPGGHIESVAGDWKAFEELAEFFERFMDGTFATLKEDDAIVRSSLGV